jgi:dephospho-CoA kinase
VLAVGLTGGIGSGKSTVAGLLAAKGAVVVDADRIAREVVEPGQPAHAALVARFGSAILAADGSIDRPALAALAFSDPTALADLNAITHPAVGEVMLERRQALDGHAGVGVFDIPLLRPAHRQLLRLDLVVVVDCPTDVALERLVAARGMDPDDARARMAAQPSRQERRAGADIVIDNSGPPELLAARVDALWQELVATAAGTDAASGGRS